MLEPQNTLFVPSQLLVKLLSCILKLNCFLTQGYHYCFMFGQYAFMYLHILKVHFVIGIDTWEGRAAVRGDGGGGLGERNWRDESKPRVHNTEAWLTVGWWSEGQEVGLGGGGQGGNGDWKRPWLGQRVHEAVCRCLVELYTASLRGFASQRRPNTLN